VAPHQSGKSGATPFLWRQMMNPCRTDDKVQLQPSKGAASRAVTLSHLTNVTNKLTSPIKICPEEIPSNKILTLSPESGFVQPNRVRKTVWLEIPYMLVCTFDSKARTNEVLFRAWVTANPHHRAQNRSVMVEVRPGNDKIWNFMKMC
jgi:hypothetical protein